jgi:hypothetical protein
LSSKSAAARAAYERSDVREGAFKKIFLRLISYGDSELTVSHLQPRVSATGENSSFTIAGEWQRPCRDIAAFDPVIDRDLGQFSQTTWFAQNHIFGQINESE